METTLEMKMMTDKTPTIIFDHNCGICTKHDITRFPVIFKPTQEKILVCGTCLSFIKDNGDCSSFEVV